MLRFLRLFIVACLLSLGFLPSTASADTIESVMMPGKVIQGHVKWEDNCQKCHKKFDKEGQNTLCKDCHKDINKDVAEKKGFHGKMKEAKNCAECHTEHKGRGASIVTLDEKTFKHTQTDFQLKGGHLGDKVKCADCHKPKTKYRDAPLTCIGCHKKDDKHKATLGDKCADCHVEKSWKDITFDHNKSNFPLKGAHAETKIKCSDCHKDNNFKQTPKDCYSCHKKDDDHKGVFGQKCADCHAEKNWKEAHFDHKQQEGHFALNGKHDMAKCSSCHKSAGQKLPQTCIGCHRSDDKHNGTLGEKCADCHNERSWKKTDFDHDKDTKFPLRDKHKAVKCDACHTTGGLKYEKLPTDCFGCHKKDDVHKGKLGSKCEDCHTARDWKKDTFNHDKTHFPLLGKHKPLKCESCHIHGLEEKLQTSCSNCHQKDDVHKGAEGKKCEDCHTEATWKVKDFDHNKTKFPLLGKHGPVDCKKCHLTGKFTEAKKDCYSCHVKDDVHKKQLGTLCEDCHNVRDWKVWDFNHDTRTKFKLTGGHKNINCLDCHRTTFTGKVKQSPTCYSCHASDDVHGGSFGPQCDRCHVDTNFKEIRVNSGVGR